jgi:hypothetical protein
MNYYAQGGQAHGLKSLTGHKIQTKDGVPSFGFGGSFQRVFKPIVNAGTQAVKAVQNVPGIKQVSDVSTQAFKPIDQALVGLDKQVGKMIPGGYGTIAQIAAAMTPGMQPLAIGLGALNGSGVMRKGGNFNLQGAMIGGATAYATSELGEYLRAAGGVNATGSTPAMIPESAYANVIPGELGDIAVNSQGQLLNASGQVLNPATQAASGAINAAPTLANSASYVSPSTLQDQYVQQGLQEGYQSAFREPSLFDKATSMSTYTKPIIDAGTSAYNSGANFLDQATTGSTYTNALSDFGKGASNTGKGIANVFTGNINPAATAAVKSGATMAPALSAAGTIYGTMNLMDQEAQIDFLKQQKAAGNIAQAEYDQALGEINRQRDYAADVVSQNPFSTNPSRDTSIGDTYYGRGNEIDNLYSRLTGEERLYAMGGSVDDEYGMDEARGLGLGTLSNGFMNMGSTPAFAAGGQPRFLSGGGDGMSDDIKATINGNQEARLADGEFVVPADVVSHLGNGSSKAGAKQLYSMMDKVRTARTGRKSQGKQINPRKYLTA